MSNKINLFKMNLFTLELLWVATLSDSTTIFVFNEKKK